MKHRQAWGSELPHREGHHEMAENYEEILRLLRELAKAAQHIIDNPPKTNPTGCTFKDTVTDFPEPTDPVPTGATVLEAVSALTGQVAGNHTSGARGTWEIVRYRVTVDTPIPASPALKVWRVMTSMDDSIIITDYHRHARGLGASLASDPTLHIGNLNTIVGVFSGAVDVDGNQHWYVDVRLDYQGDGPTVQDYPHPDRVQLVLVPA